MIVSPSSVKPERKGAAGLLHEQTTYSENKEKMHQPLSQRQLATEIWHWPIRICCHYCAARILGRYNKHIT